jgi:hypothetical protein
MEKCPRANKRCPEFHKKLGCHLVSHHIFYPASLYRSELESEFRELDRNKVPMCKDEEGMLHETHPQGPPKPTTEVMLFCVQQEKVRKHLSVYDRVS